MKDIGRQFHGQYKLAEWIQNAIGDDNVKALINAHKFDQEPMGQNIRELRFWAIGPKKDKGKALFLYGHPVDSNGSTEVEITSINPKKRPNLLVRDNLGHWYEISFGESIFSYAKQMDMFLHGVYTDIPPLATNFILDNV